MSFETFALISQQTVIIIKNNNITKWPEIRLHSYAAS